MESQRAREDSFQQNYNTPEKYIDIYRERELKTHTDRES